MGASNVAKVFTYWRHLSHREARMLTYMANVALDQDMPPIYFGGWEAAATAIGMDPEKKRASSKETFRQVMSLLRDVGAVVSSGQARAGVRAEYALALDPKVTYVPVGTGRDIKWTSVSRDKATLPLQGQDHVAPANQGHIAPAGTRPRCERDKVTLPPRSTQEPQEEYREEEVVVEVPMSPTARTGISPNDASNDPEPTIQEQRERWSAQLLQRQAAYEKTQKETA